VAVQRVYELARAVLDAEDAERRAQADEAGMFVAELLDGLTNPPEPSRSMSPAQASPGGWPRVRG